MRLVFKSCEWLFILQHTSILDTTYTNYTRLWNEAAYNISKLTKNLKFLWKKTIFFLVVYNPTCYLISAVLLCFNFIVFCKLDLLFQVWVRLSGSRARRPSAHQTASAREQSASMSCTQQQWQSLRTRQSVMMNWAWRRAHVCWC